MAADGGGVAATLGAGRTVLRAGRLAAARAAMVAGGSCSMNVAHTVRMSSITAHIAAAAATLMSGGRPNICSGVDWIRMAMYFAAFCHTTACCGALGSNVTSI